MEELMKQLKIAEEERDICLKNERDIRVAHFLGNVPPNVKLTLKPRNGGRSTKKNTRTKRQLKKRKKTRKNFNRGKKVHK
jgi:hypothetical protein